MGAWGFVSLAYGIVCAVILVYWIILKRRYRKVETELKHLQSEHTADSHETN